MHAVPSDENRELRINELVRSDPLITLFGRVEVLMG